MPAVAGLIQRQAAEGRESAAAGETEVAPPAADLSHVIVTAMAQAADLGERARTATQSTWRHDALRLQAIYLAFPATHELPVRTLGTSIMAQPQFVGRRLTVVHRGNVVKVLRTAGSWYCVQAPNGVQGWMPRNHLWAFSPRLRSGDSGTGTSRDQTMAGRG